MNFNRRVITLAAAAGVLLLIYILSFVFSGESRARRNATMALLDSKTALNAVSIELRGSDSGAVKLEKQKDDPAKSESWVIQKGGVFYPVKTGRVDDVIAALCKKSEYPVRGRSADEAQTFGFSANSPKITVQGENGVLCEVSFGGRDATGKEVYLRLQSGGVVYSGADVFSAYLDGQEKSWFNLALFPDEKTKPVFSNVQRVILVPPEPGEGIRPAPFTLVRKGDGWEFEGGGAVKKSEADATLRYILDAQAEDFVPKDTVNPSDFSEKAGSAVLELGSGERVTLTLGPKVDTLSYVKVSDSPYYYKLSSWAVSRMWRDKKELVEIPSINK